MENMTDNMKNLFLKEWWQTSAEFPAFNRMFGIEKQKSNERKMDLIVEQMIREIRKHPGIAPKDYPEWGSKIRSFLCAIGDEILELGGGGMDILLDGGYCKVTSDFIAKARSFDPSINTRDIVQAMRNALIMNCIQVLTGRTVEFTPALFAYSMLYPYTDNYLDATGISFEKKRELGVRLRTRLKGDAAASYNPYEARLFKLVDIIEAQYDRRAFPQIYDSLLAIHAAQQKSLRQQNGSLSPFESDIPGISFEKGGASVLADAYLVNGSLSEAQAMFMFGFGVFLQLADDAQDVDADLRNRHMTIFSYTAGRWDLDPLMNRLLNFMFNLLENDKCFNAPQMIEHKRLIGASCTLLLLSAVANNSSKYGRDYIKRIERYSPLRFGYLRKLYKKAGKEFANLFGKSGSEKRPVDVMIARALAESCGTCG